ncbi:MAG: hypothetical protein H0U75_09265 [Legionella sp.]|nr:hypothetical protein [Legionella sp.]
MPNIKYLIIVAYTKESTPIGEAPVGGLVPPSMTPIERTAMTTRLFRCIENLMNKAFNNHLADCMITGTQALDTDYITSLCTNEFFFIPKNPLL